MIKENSMQNAKPQLAPPGAGVPWPQGLVLKYFVAPFIAGRTDWSVSEERFKKLTLKILKEVEGLSDAEQSTKVLVPPQAGLEDSSRFWSIAMVLEHLVIVGKGISYAISELTSDRIPQGTADTATVKPGGALTASQSVAEFKKFAEIDYKNLVSGLKNKNSKLRFKHPWFGNITAKQWFWVLAIHHRLHLKQIREIKKRLI